MRPASLVYRTSSRAAKATQTLSKKKEKKKRKETTKKVIPEGHAVSTHDGL